MKKTPKKKRKIGLFVVNTKGEKVPVTVTLKRVQMVCPDCGSTDVTRDASADWNVDKQTWELFTTYDACYCGKCDETKRYFVEAELNELPAPSGNKMLADRKNWQYEVANGDTVLGFEDWKDHKRESEEG